MSSHKEAFTIRDATAAASRLFESIDTPLSLSCYLLMKNHEWEQLINKAINPSDYLTANSFALDYQSVSFFKKTVGLPTGNDTSSVALAKFLEAENQCRLVNERLSSRDGRNAELHSILYTASFKIRDILGKVPDLSNLPHRFGPGASSTCSGRSVNLLTKLQSNIECSRDAYPLVVESLKSNHHWLGSILNIDIVGPCSLLRPLTYTNINWNVLNFVPKNAKTDRAICIEPNSVVPLQLAHGSYIRNRLLFAGLDLNKQADINRHYAYLGSIDGTYATIDLSSASDTIAIELIKLLLPEEWYFRLMSLRSEYTKLPDGSFICNEKFSSMGNGFTFELETLVFYAISLAVRDLYSLNDRIFCFGDDIIVPSCMASTLIEVLNYAGFSVNHEKTFLNGPFRESCGHDYFLGINVRPFFLKDSAISNFYDLYPVLNGIRHAANRLNGSLKDCDRTYFKAWLHILLLIPSQHRHFGPVDYGDEVILSSRRETLHSVGLFFGILKIKHVVRSLRSFKLDTSSYYLPTKVASILYGHKNHVSIRGSGVTYKVRSLDIPIWHWDDYRWA